MVWLHYLLGHSTWYLQEARHRADRFDRCEEVITVIATCSNGREWARQQPCNLAVMEHGLDRSGVMSKHPTGNGRFRSHPYRKKGYLSNHSHKVRRNSTLENHIQIYAVATTTIGTDNLRESPLRKSWVAKLASNQITASNRILLMKSGHAVI